MLECPGSLTEEAVGEILGCLSFVTLEESVEDRQLLSRLYDMLTRKHESGVLPDDLLSFLAVLCNIQQPLYGHEQNCSLSTAAVSHWSV